MRALARGRPHRPGRRGPRAGGGERRGQVHPDQDPRRGVPEGLGGDPLRGRARSSCTRRTTPCARGIKVVFQELALIKGLSVAENVFLESFPLRPQPDDRLEDADRPHAGDPGLHRPGPRPDAAGGQAHRVPAADGGDCAGAVPRGEGGHHGRAHLGPDAERDQAPVRRDPQAEGNGHRDPLRHPQAGGGLRALRPGHRLPRRACGSPRRAIAETDQNEIVTDMVGREITTLFPRRPTRARGETVLDVQGPVHRGEAEGRQPRGARRRGGGRVRPARRRTARSSRRRSSAWTASPAGEVTVAGRAAAAGLHHALRARGPGAPHRGPQGGGPRPADVGGPEHDPPVPAGVLHRGLHPHAARRTRARSRSCSSSPSRRRPSSTRSNT